MKLVMLDICSPQYFQGYPEPVLSVMVARDMTRVELAQAIEDSYNNEFEHLTPTWPEFTNQQIAALAADFVLEDMPFRHTPGLLNWADYEEDDEGVYLYIALEKE